MVNCGVRKVKSVKKIVALTFSIPIVLSKSSLSFYGFLG